MLRSILWSQFHFSLIYGGERERERERKRERSWKMFGGKMTSCTMHMTQLVELSKLSALHITKTNIIFLLVVGTQGSKQLCSFFIDI